MGSLMAPHRQAWACRHRACMHTVCQGASYPARPGQWQRSPLNHVRYLRWPELGGPASGSVAASFYNSSNGWTGQQPLQANPGEVQGTGPPGGVDAQELQSLLATGEFELGGNPFTYQSARAYISTRLRAYAEGQRVSVLDEDMLLHLIKFHPKYTEKVGQAGISHFSVQASPQGTYCFYLHRNDGTSSDFSYMKCLATYAYMHITRQVDAIGNPTAPIPDLPPVSLPTKPLRDRGMAAGRSARRARHRAVVPEEMLQALDADLDPLYGAQALGPAGGRRPGLQSDPGYMLGPRGSHAPLPPPQLQEQLLQQDMWSSSDDWATSSLDELASASWDSVTAVSPNKGYGSGHARPFAGAGQRYAAQAAPGYASQPQQQPQQPQQQQQQSQQQQSQQQVLDVHLGQPADNQLSWKECMLALRAAVVPQLRQFKAQAMAAGKLVCSQTGQQLTSDTAVVAYQPPQEFKHLVVAWMKQAGLASRGQLVVNYAGEQARPTMQDAAQMASWQQYYSQYARLVVINRSQNAA